MVGFDNVHGVEAVVTIWVVQDEGVGVDIGDKGDRWDAPKIHLGALPTFEYRFCRDHDCGGMGVVEVDFVLVIVIDGSVACHRKFAGSEEQVVDQRRDNVDLMGRSTYVVKELVDCCCWGDGAIREVKHHRGYAPSWEGRILRKDSA